jgi:hypothetical protein
VTSSYTAYLGLDVGKGEHHAVGLDPTGKRLHDAPLPNTEPKLHAMYDKLATHGPVLVVVDQQATIGALPVAVARACGHQVAYLPGPCRTRCARSTSATTRWQSSTSSSATTTSPPRPPESATASAGCSPASTPP